jgi:hypothetical protein
MINPHLSFAHGEAHRAELRRQAGRYRRGRLLRVQARLTRLAERYLRARLQLLQVRPIPVRGERNVCDEAADAAA